MILENINDVDPSAIFYLGKLCLNESQEQTLRTRDMDLVYYATLLMEWGHLHDADMTLEEMRILAFCHLESWMTRGFFADVSIYAYFFNITYELTE
jgi:hypothetical protein